MAIALPGGCDFSDDSVAIPARAAESVKRLPASEREAAEALVRLETAARNRDGETLCQSVYVFTGGPSPECPGAMRKLFPTGDGHAVDVLSVRSDAPSHAFAKAATVTVTADGSHESFPNTMFELRRRAGEWRVAFQD